MVDDDGFAGKFAGVEFEAQLGPKSGEEVGGGAALRSDTVIRYRDRYRSA